MHELYCCAYYERLVKSRCYYATSGRAFTIKAVRCMLRSMTLPDLKDQLHDLYIEVKESVNEYFKNGKALNLPKGIDVVNTVFEGK